MQDCLKSYQCLHENYGVSRETYEKLAQYVGLLIEWNQKFNLIGPNTEADVWNRHIIDSVQLLKFINKDNNLLDFGCGAGLPGMVLHICGVKNVRLVESIEKKCKFLFHVKQELNLDVEILNERVENVAVRQGEIVTARAVASLDKLFKLSQKHLVGAKKIIFLKGKNYKKEVISAEKFWSFKFKKYKSVTSEESVIIEIDSLEWKL